ncbi:hypothetical protein [Vagococcus acidifermentans]|uniref:Uncharacterized protein n=1 Tax=Vagococcus acidifermentans TaxID=564710 RepID=A0A430ASX9_9ENTE|nr:hypothetical protein [Vagococcus acidifermentans]RSU11146.1 hypothetical protein CBF27_08575 [Vagococcus acidifermentans]
MKTFILTQLNAGKTLEIIFDRTHSLTIDAVTDEFAGSPDLIQVANSNYRDTQLINLVHVKSILVYPS